MPIISLRLNEEERKKIERLKKRLKEDRSAAARTLIHEGWILYWMKAYCSGKISLGKLSEMLEQPLTETMDLLSELGIQSPLDYSDYVEGLNILS